MGGMEERLSDSKDRRLIGKLHHLSQTIGAACPIFSGCVLSSCGLRRKLRSGPLLGSGRRLGTTDTAATAATAGLPRPFALLHSVDSFGLLDFLEVKGAFLLGLRELGLHLIPPYARLVRNLLGQMRPLELVEVFYVPEIVRVKGTVGATDLQTHTGRK